MLVRLTFIMLLVIWFDRTHVAIIDKFKWAMMNMLKVMG